MTSAFTLRGLTPVLVAVAILAGTFSVHGADKRIVLIAGRPSHPPGMHEFRAGVMLLQKALGGVTGVTVQVYDERMAVEDRRRRCASTTTRRSTTPTPC